MLATRSHRVFAVLSAFALRILNAKTERSAKDEKRTLKKEFDK